MTVGVGLEEAHCPGLIHTTPHLHPQVEVAIDSDVIGSTALAFCGDKEGMRSP